MPEPKENLGNTRWRRAAGIVLLAALVWHLACMFTAYFLVQGKEFIDDAPQYEAYVEDPAMLLTDRHRAYFGAAVAPPLLPLELKTFHLIFAPAGNFLAFRLTMLVHLVFALGIGFAVAFRFFGAPKSRANWFWAAVVAVVPVAWVTSVVTVQDDSVAAAWAGVCLAACVWIGPVAGAVAAGCGMFFGKIFLALAFLGLWIATPGRRWQISAVGLVFVGGLFAFLFWRDGALLYSQYAYPPYMGAGPYGLIWMIAGEYSIFTARNISLVATGIGFAIYTWIAVRRRLSLISAVTGLHALFLMTYFGAMPEYYVWFLPFLLVTLWAAYQEGLWGTFAVGWFSTFFAYAYKALYGINVNFAGQKPELKNWGSANIPLDIQSLQIAAGLAAVACTIAFAVLVLLRDPGRTFGSSPKGQGSNTG